MQKTLGACTACTKLLAPSGSRAVGLASHHPAPCRSLLPYLSGGDKLTTHQVPERYAVPEHVNTLQHC